MALAPRRDTGRALGLVALYIASSAYVFAMWLTDTRQYINLNGFEPARFVDMVYGAADKPYVLRALLPFAIRVLCGLLPSGAREFLQGGIYLRVPLVGKVMDWQGWERANLVEYAIGAGLMYLSLLGAMGVLRRLAARLYDAERWLVDLLPVGAVLVLPVFFQRGTHFVYDFPALFFFLLGAWALFERRWPLYYLALALGVINKETAILLALILVLRQYRRMGTWRLLGHLALQVALFVALRAWLTMLFRDNAGATFENHLRWNLRASLFPYSFGALFDVLGVAVLIGRRYTQKPLYLRQCLVVIVPLYLSYLVGGNRGEIRVFYEVFPFLFLLGAPTIAEVLGWRMLAWPDDS